jgi:hypothetical protein
MYVGPPTQLKPHSPGAKAGFFAIANAPDKSGKGVAEFLIKRTEGSAWICDAKQGDVSEGRGGPASCTAAQHAHVGQVAG